MTSLGTLLIQRLDAALGNAISRQTGLVNTGRNFINQPAEPARPSAIDPSTVRDSRESVDRTLDQNRQRTRTGANRAVADSRPALAGTRPGGATPASSAQTTLGTAARTILTLLADYTPGSARVVGHRPLIASTPAGQAGLTTDAQLARNLNQAIRTSGLFYESHLKSLTQGEYRLSAILREPQSRLPPQPAQTRMLNLPMPSSTPQLPPHLKAAGGHPAAPGTPPAGGRPGSPADMPTGMPNQASPGSSSPSASASTNHQAGQGQAAAQAAGQATPGVDPATHHLVRQQLEILADQAIQWRGEAWPGAPMDWRIERHTPDHDPTGEHDEDPDESWASHITLQLPQLGEVRATVRLDGPRVRLALQTDRQSSATLFGQQAGQLEKQLSMHQLQLAALHIDRTPTSVGPIPPSIEP